MSEEKKAIARRIYDEYWNQNKAEVLDEIIAEDVVNHGLPPGLPPGLEGTKAYLGAFLNAFPDVQMTVERQVAEGETVVTLWTANATHTGDLMDIPASGERVTVTGIDVHRFDGDRIVEAWGQFDEMGLMQQIGVIPSQGE